MTRDEQIKALTEKLLELMATPEAPQQVQQTQQPTPQALSLNELDSYTKTITKLKDGLNVDVNIVRQIMRRVDEVYGKAENYQYTAPMYETFEKILKG